MAFVGVCCFFLGDWCCLFVVLHVCSLCQGSDLGSIGFAVGGLASLDGRFLWELHHGVGVCWGWTSQAEALNGLKDAGALMEHDVKQEPWRMNAKRRSEVSFKSALKTSLILGDGSLKSLILISSRAEKICHGKSTWFLQLFLSHFPWFHFGSETVNYLTTLKASDI